MKAAEDEVDVVEGAEGVRVGDIDFDLLFSLRRLGRRKRLLGIVVGLCSHALYSW